MGCDSHEWVVFSTCLCTVELMVQCVTCGAFGAVPKPTMVEWRRAGTGKYYEWHDSTRVVIKEPSVPPYVVKA